MAGVHLVQHFRRFILQQKAFSTIASVRQHCSDVLVPRSVWLPKNKCSKSFYRRSNGGGSEFICSKGRCPRTWPQISSLSSRGLTTVQGPRPKFGSSRRKGAAQSNNASAAQYSSGPSASRVKGLMIATYISGAVGIALLTVIGFRYYGRFRKRARGIEELDVPHYPRRSRYLNRYRGFSIYSGHIDTVVNDIPWFEVRPDDVWIVSYPKAGTTWLQEIVYLICTDLDFDTARAVKVDDRFPFLDFITPGLKEIAKMESPRFIKTHLPFSLLPKQLEEKKPKVIYIARNPKDTVVSLQAFQELINMVKFLGTMEDFAQNFVDGLSIYGPWSKHVQEGWEHRNKDNVLFITYEDLHRDFRGKVQEIAGFLGKTLTDRQVEQIREHCSFRSMRSNDSVNYSWKASVWKEGNFLRKGEVGDWKNHLSPQTSAKFDAMTDSLQALGLHFVDS